MDNKKYLQLKEKVNHGNLQLPMELYKGDFNNKCDYYPHWHDEMELLYVAQGSGNIHIDLNTYNIDTGDFIIIPKGALHYVNWDKTTKIKYSVLVFNLSMLETSDLDFCQINFINPLVQNELHIKNIIKPSDLGYSVILNYFNNIVENYTNKNFGFQLELKGFFFLLFFNLFNKGYIIKTTNKTISNENMKIKKIKKVINHIQLNYKNSISVKELAEIAQYSDYHFIRFFKEYTGKTCMEFINSFRVQKATDLIINTNLSITEIAYEVGFGDVSYFIKTFKKYFNTSPNNFRKDSHH